MLMLRRTHERKMRELGERWESMWRTEKEAREAAEKELRRVEGAISDAAGIHVGRPYRENLIDGVTFPVVFSAYVVREFSKRLDFSVLSEIIESTVSKQIRNVVYGADPTIRKMFRGER